MIQKKESLLRKAAIFAMDKWKAYVRLAQVWGPVFGNHYYYPENYWTLGPVWKVTKSPTTVLWGFFLFLSLLLPLQSAWEAYLSFEGAMIGRVETMFHKSGKLPILKKKGAMDQKSMRKTACQKENVMM